MRICGVLQCLLYNLIRLFALQSTMARPRQRAGRISHGSNRVSLSAPVFSANVGKYFLMNLIPFVKNILCQTACCFKTIGHDVSRLIGMIANVEQMF